jgi:hypothetical protein
MNGGVATGKPVMDRRYIDDNHVVARYLADRLTDDEREAFEAYYLEHPDVVQELEAAARFKVGLMKLRDTGELSRLLQREQRRQWPYFAAAAAVAVLVIGAFVIIDRTPERHPILAATVEALRGTNGSPPLTRDLRSPADPRQCRRRRESRCRRPARRSSCACCPSSRHGRSAITCACFA